jgi:hypothetical protein
MLILVVSGVGGFQCKTDPPMALVRLTVTIQEANPWVMLYGFCWVGIFHRCDDK